MYKCQVTVARLDTICYLKAEVDAKRKGAVTS